MVRALHSPSLSTATTTATLPPPLPCLPTCPLPPHPPLSPPAHHHCHFPTCRAKSGPSHRQEWEHSMRCPCRSEQGSAPWQHSRGSPEPSQIQWTGRHCLWSDDFFFFFVHLEGLVLPTPALQEDVTRTAAHSSSKEVSIKILKSHIFNQWQSNPSTLESVRDDMHIQVPHFHEDCSSSRCLLPGTYCSSESTIWQYSHLTDPSLLYTADKQQPNSFSHGSTFNNKILSRNKMIKYLMIKVSKQKFFSEFYMKCVWYFRHPPELSSQLI